MECREDITRQFYEWEQQGRGWQTWPYPVALEPPFRPFLGYEQTSQGDDGRVPTLLERGLRRVGKLLASAPDPVEINDPQAGDPAPAAEVDSSELVALVLTLPPGLDLAPAFSTRLLTAFGSAKTPTAYEIHADSREVTLQFVCHESEVRHISQQLRAHVADLGIEIRTLEPERWHEDGELLVVDFVLAREFMLPLETSSGGLDALTPIIATLSGLKHDEEALFQVLFQPVRHAWADSATRALFTNSGQPIFADAPDLLRKTEGKLGEPLFATALRMATSTPNEEQSFTLLRNMARGLAPLCRQGGNRLVPVEDEDLPLDLQRQNLVLRQSHRLGMLLSLSELTTLVHLPASSIRSDRLRRQLRRTRKAPGEVLGNELLIGKNEHAGESVHVSLSTAQRLRHCYIIGASGTGKSTLLINMALQDIEAGRGVGILDPHGDLVDEVLARIPSARQDDVLLLDPSDPDFVVSFNVLAAHSDLERQLLSSDLVAVFRRLSTSWGDQMTSVLANAVLAFLESEEGGTLSDLRRFLVDKVFRARFLKTVKDPEVVYFWTKEFPLLSGRPQAPLLTRLDAFLRPRLIRHMVAQKKNSVDLRAMLDGQGIFLARLSQGAIGEENAHLLGALLVAKLQQVAQSRQELSHERRAPFFLYLDEFQHFITPSMAAILSGARKYGLSLTLAHQDLSQLGRRESGVLGAAISNPATRICFRVGDLDARRLDEGFAHFDAKDLQSLGVGEAICRVDQARHDFNLMTSRPPPLNEGDARARLEDLIARSRARYARPREEIEAELLRGYGRAPQLQPMLREEPAPEPAEAPRSRPSPKTAVPQKDKKALSPPELPGRGGKQHKYLQDLIRQWGQEAGYIVKVDSPTPDGKGAVDVLLERDGERIAFEVSVTTPASHELKNLSKCLAAGFDEVIAVSSRSGQRERLIELARNAFSASEVKRVRVLSPEEVFDYLASKRERTATSRVKGYHVTVRQAELSAQERKARMDAIARALQGQ